jgi:two-component system, response regulator YesN
MYRMLIVDDEIHAVNGLKSGIEWEKLEITEVFTAYNNRQAKEVFANHQIDLMICDIEMPQENGLELLAWVKDNYESTKSIFLTCHAEFSYAKEAIHLGSLGYLLKPVIFSELEQVLGKAINIIKKEREASASSESYNHYYKLWSMHQPLLIERFWMDLLDGHIASEAEAIQQSLVNADISYTSDMRFVPILIKVQHWHNKILLRDERLMEHELRNVALKMLIREDSLSQVLQIKRGLFLVVHAICGIGTLDKGQLRAEYQSYIDDCNREFSCDLSCYVGAKAAIAQIPDIYEALLEFAKNFVMFNKIVFIDEHVSLQKPANPALNAGWHELFIQGKREKWRDENDKVFASLSSLESFDAKLLHEFFHDFMQMVYAVLKQKDLPAHLIFSQSERISEEELSLSSVDALQEWVRQVGEKVFDCIAQVDKDRSVTEKIKLYISQNMGYDLTRESIAKEFYLNPDYLARIFKKETGLSISDYLIQERIRIAKDLLVNSDMPVKEIVSRVGYSNFSYFSKIFKEISGLNPLAFRKTNTH